MAGRSERRLPCNSCGSSQASVSVEGRDLCDRCADREIAAATGWPLLPEPPPPEVILGADGGRHVFRYRLFRWPGRVVAIAEEVGRGEAGHRLEVGVDHLEDAEALRERIRLAARSAVGRVPAVRDEGGALQLEGTEVVGRLEEGDDPYAEPNIVFDGRVLTWTEFGALLRSMVGWSFHLRLGDDAEISVDTRSVPTIPPDAVTRRLLEDEAPPWFVIALDHYPTPDEWRDVRH